MNTNPFRGSFHERQMLSIPPGAGGFAGRTVPLADPNRVVGSMGLNTETSPIEVRDDTGAIVPFPQHDGTFRPPDFVVVESWRRNRTEYPSPASFQLRMQNPKREVLAIDVLELNFPNVDSTVPTNREFLLLNGLVKDGTYSPQANIPRHSFEVMLEEPKTTATLANTYQYDTSALWRGAYDSTLSFQHWKREGWHRKTWFPEPIDRLTHLEFTVVDPQGTLYDFPTDSEWSATLQIFCKQ